MNNAPNRPFDQEDLDLLRGISGNVVKEYDENIHSRGLRVPLLRRKRRRVLARFFQRFIGRKG